mgnify:CR=1 FL=1
MAHENFWVAVVRPYRDKLITTAQASTLLREALASGQRQEIEMEFRPSVGYFDLRSGWLMGTLRKLEKTEHIHLMMDAYDPNNSAMMGAGITGPSQWVDGFLVTRLRVNFGQQKEVVSTQRLPHDSERVGSKSHGEDQAEFMFDDKS